MSIADWFRPKWKHSNTKVRIEALHQVPWSVLAIVIETDKDKEVRQTAIERLTNEIGDMHKRPLGEWRKYYDLEYRVSIILLTDIVNILNDQEVLGFIAKSFMNETVRRAAAVKIGDQRILADIAKNAEPLQIDPRFGIYHAEDDVAIFVVERLTDQALLADLAMTKTPRLYRNGEDTSVAQAAVERLSNQELLTKVVNSSEDNLARLAAIKKLTDQTVIAQIAKCNESSQVCQIAVEKLIDRNVLTEIAKEHAYYSVRKTAAMYVSPGHIWCTRCSEFTLFTQNTSQINCGRQIVHRDTCNVCGWYSDEYHG